MDELGSSSESSSNYFNLPPLYALIIGINTYTSPAWPDLNVSVQDADDFEHYLTTRLSVPPSNIINLRNKIATRSAILNAFQKLKELTSIPLKSRHSTAAEEIGIIIFFSGHGTRGEKPKEWQDWSSFDNYYEAICPSDMGTKEGEKSDMDGVPAIPDRTIAALVNQLSESRGNNITLIFDCCHAAGINRKQTEADSEGYIPRYISNPPPLPFNYDDDIITGSLSRSLAVPKAAIGKNQSSHVLLAACGKEQRAYEHPNKRNGVFTYALLKVLNETNIETLTYTSLMHRLKMPVWQNAYCDGVEVERRLFNARMKGGDPNLIPALKIDNHLIMDAGIIQGVTVGSLVEIHATNLYPLLNQPNPPFATLTVTTVSDNSSTLALPQRLTNILQPRSRLYCRIIQRNSNSLLISSNDLKWLESVYTEDFCATHQVSIIRDTMMMSRKADLELTVDNGIVFIDHHFALAANHIGTRSPFTIPSKNDTKLLHQLILHILHFRFHLQHTNSTISNEEEEEESDRGGRITVSLDMRELKEKWISEHESIVKPIGENVFATDPGMVIVDDEEEKTYGIVIENHTNIPLYPHLFYFDPSELSITPWYTPPKITNSTPNFSTTTTTTTHTGLLAPNSKFSIGHTRDGLTPWTFYIRPTETKDVGFFKLFLTTTPAANLNCIVQDSAFASSSGSSSSVIRGGGSEQGVSDEEDSDYLGEEMPVWDEVVMTVVQLRR